MDEHSEKWDEICFLLSDSIKHVNNGVQDFEIIYAIFACFNDMRAICGGVKKGGSLMSEDAIKV